MEIRNAAAIVTGGASGLGKATERAILPGLFDTPLLNNNPTPVLDRLGRQVPFPPHLGKPSEFAYLACEIVRNLYLNGESFRLDGGLRMGFGRK